MEGNPNKPAADVRAASVARLRRAASLPRMKDGRRPAVHGSDGDGSTGITPSVSTATTPFTSTGELPPVSMDTNELNREEEAAHHSATPNAQEKQENDGQEQAGLTDSEPAIAPALTRGRRRRSRSRGSRSGTPKLEIPPSSTTSIITPVQRPGTPAAAISIGASITPESQSKDSYQYAPMDGPPAQQQPPESSLNTASSPQRRDRTFLTPISPFQPSLFSTGQPAFSPNGTSGPPTLAELQSNYTAGGLSRSVSVGRAHALHKLTGGNLSPADSELFPTTFNNNASSPSAPKQSIAAISETRNVTNTPPPAGVIARSNTVAGGERGAARAAMLQKLRGRVGPVTPNATMLALEPSGNQSPGVQDDADETVVNTGTEEVLVMPEIVARENKRRRRRSKRTSSNPAGLNSLDGAGHELHDHHSQFSSDERRFGSEGTSGSAMTTPASQFSPLPNTHPLPVPGSPPRNPFARFTPSPRPSGHNSPALPLDGMVSLLTNSSPLMGGMNGISSPPPAPEVSRRIDELNDVDLLKQEERLARYHQGLNLLRAASGGSATGANNIKVLIEEEDEPLPTPVMEPTSAGHPDVPEAASRPSVDSMEPLEPPRRMQHVSNSPSLQSSTDGQSSPGFGNIPGMGRVPIVMHQYGPDGQPTGFGRKGRVKAGGIDEEEYGDDSVPLVNLEPFPMSIVLSPGKDQPIQYSEYEHDEQNATENRDSQVVHGSRLAPAPRSWEPKSTASASWIVDSYFRDEDDNGEDYAALQSVQQGSSPQQTTDEDQDWVPVVPPKDDWDHVLPQPPGFASRTSPAPVANFQPDHSSAIPIPTRQGVMSSNSLAVPATVEDDERSSAVSGSDFPDKNSSSSGPPASVPRRLGTGSGMRDTGASQDSYRMGYTASPLPEADEDGSSERKNSPEKISHWTKVKQTFTGRRSRSNSLVRERGEKAESGISRESGSSQQLVSPASNGSATVVANLASNNNGVPGLGLSSPSGMHSTISIPRGVSPLPPPSPGDYAKHNDPKLMPFPGIYQLEEQRHNRKISEANSPGEQNTSGQQAIYQNLPMHLNPAALSAPLPPSTRHSPDEGSELGDRGLQGNPSTGNLRQQDRAWPFSQDEYFEPGSSMSRAGSTGSNVKKWLKVLQPGSGSNSLSPSPSPYHQQQAAYSQGNPTAGEKVTAPPTANLNRRPSAAEIFLPHGGLQRRPSTPNLLQGLSRKSSLADTNAGGLKSTPSKGSLRKAFGLFSHESKESNTVLEEDSTTRSPFARLEPGVTMVASVQEAFGNSTLTSLPEAAPVVSSSPPEEQRPPSPAPLSLPPPSTVPIPPPAVTSPVEPPRTTRTPPPTVSRMRSPPPNASRPQSPLMRAQSPSILKKDSISRAQSPPIRTQSPGFELSRPSQIMSPPRSHSPFLVHSPSLTRSKSNNNYMVKALSSAEIIASIDSLLNRNSSGSIDSKTKSMEDPPRKLLLVTPVLQVVSRDSVKDRTLFLFSDVLVIAKCMTSVEGGLVMDKSFTIKNVLELKRCSGPIISMGSQGLSGDRRSPFLQSFVNEFSREQTRAVKKLCDAVGVRKDQSTFIADILFKTHELPRSRLGDFLARRSSRDILHAFVDKFNFAGIRIDHALRIFLLSILLSDEAEPSSLENLLTGFAARWFAANGNMVAFDKECARKLVISIILLNASHHMRHAHSDAPATPQAFFESVRGYDPRYSIKDDLLEDIYEAIKQEKISAPKEMPGDTRLAVTVNGATSPMHFIYRVKSDVVRVRIPAADPNFRIHLLGQGLLFEPPTLHFANSSEATFRVTGTSLGTKAILYWRAGANAHLYSAMPLASEIVIERAFMRNTLRVEVKEPRPMSDRDSLESELESTYGGSKKVYVFSIEDPREYDHWGKVLKTRINRANGILEPERPPTAQGIFAPILSVGAGVPPRIRRAAEMVAFEVLKESLMGSGSISSVPSSPPETHITKNTFSASFGQMFSPDSQERPSKSSSLSEIVRNGREIETLCVQNSLIPALISMLATAQRDSTADNSQVGSGIGRPQTPKAINVVR